MGLGCTSTWGSRPRLLICRAFGTGWSARVTSHDVVIGVFGGLPNPGAVSREADIGVFDAQQTHIHEPRSGGTSLAWGVSPRFNDDKNQEAAKRRQTNNDWVFSVSRPVPCDDLIPNS